LREGAGSDDPGEIVEDGDGIHSSAYGCECPAWQ
jgi:hypothetical protein